MLSINKPTVLNATSETSMEIRCIADGRAEQQSTSIKINQSISVAFFSLCVRVAYFRSFFLSTSSISQSLRADKQPVVFDGFVYVLPMKYVVQNSSFVFFSFI